MGRAFFLGLGAPEESKEDGVKSCHKTPESADAKQTAVERASSGLVQHRQIPPYSRRWKGEAADPREFWNPGNWI